MIAYSLVSRPTNWVEFSHRLNIKSPYDTGFLKPVIYSYITSEIL